jgi:hypothetical protein
MVSASRRFLAVALRIGLSGGMKVLSYKSIQSFLTEIDCFQFGTHGLQDIPVRIVQLPKVSGIYLSVSTEPPEIMIDHGRIKVSKQAGRKFSIKPMAAHMKVIQMIFKT